MIWIVKEISESIRKDYYSPSFSFALDQVIIFLKRWEAIVLCSAGHHKCLCSFDTCNWCALNALDILVILQRSLLCSPIVRKQCLNYFKLIKMYISIFVIPFCYYQTLRLLKKIKIKNLGVRCKFLYSLYIIFEDPLDWSRTFIHLSPKKGPSFIVFMEGIKAP